jgi:hypothetical protein
MQAMIRRYIDKANDDWARYVLNLVIRNDDFSVFADLRHTNFNQNCLTYSCGKKVCFLNPVAH